MKAISAQVVMFMTTPQKYATHAWQYSILVLLLGQSVCSSPATKELHGRIQSGWEVSRLDNQRGRVKVGAKQARLLVTTLKEN